MVSRGNLFAALMNQVQKAPGRVRLRSGNANVLTNCSPS